MKFHKGHAEKYLRLPSILATTNILPEPGSRPKKMQATSMDYNRRKHSIITEIYHKRFAIYKWNLLQNLHSSVLHSFLLAGHLPCGGRTSNVSLRSTCRGIELFDDPNTDAPAAGGFPAMIHHPRSATFHLPNTQTEILQLAQLIPTSKSRLGPSFVQYIDQFVRATICKLLFHLVVPVVNDRTISTVHQAAHLNKLPYLLRKPIPAGNQGSL